MLDADMNSRYWKYLVSRHHKIDRGLKVFLAIMSSGVVAGWGLGDAMPWLWKTLSCGSALVAISLPFLNHQKNIEQMSFLAGKWGALRIDYENLWLEFNNSPDSKTHNSTYKKIRQIESELQGKETKLPHDKKLLRYCFEEVIQSRGLS